MGIQFSRVGLYQNRLTSYRSANGSRPEVFHASYDGHEVVVKDYDPCPGLFGIVLGPLLVYRERKALKLLEKISGIPHCHDCNDSRVLVTSYCPQTKLVLDLAHELDWQKFESKLTRLIADMHKKGVVHCDLRSPGNVLIDDEDNPHIVDFGASFSRSKWNPLWNLAFKQAIKADYSAILKIKAKVRPDLLTEHERKQYATDVKRGGWFRLLTGQIRQLTQSWLSQTK